MASQTCWESTPLISIIILPRSVYTIHQTTLHVWSTRQHHIRTCSSYLYTVTVSVWYWQWFIGTATVIYVSCCLRIVIINRIREFIIVFIIYIGQVSRYQMWGRSRKSHDKQYNGQKKKIKRTNNDLQHTTQKSKEQREPRQNRGWTCVFRKSWQFLFF